MTRAQRPQPGRQGGRDRVSPDAAAAEGQPSRGSGPPGPRWQGEGHSEGVPARPPPVALLGPGPGAPSGSVCRLRAPRRGAPPSPRPRAALAGSRSARGSWTPGWQPGRPALLGGPGGRRVRSCVPGGRARPPGAVWPEATPGAMGNVRALSPKPGPSRARASVPALHRATRGVEPPGAPRSAAGPRAPGPRLGPRLRLHGERARRGRRCVPPNSPRPSAWTSPASPRPPEGGPQARLLPICS